MELLRFTTAGSIDDGKSTLTGRLLYDTGNIKKDILASISVNEEEDRMNLAFITDGLRTEREQGITIDVAYKYFSTKSRKYIITDAPGHFQYTKNLVTGASSVDVMVILIDAQNGITTQTKRHAMVASFLQIAHVVVAVNKMDLKGYDENVFSEIKTKFLQLSNGLQLHNVSFIPISALNGDNVCIPSKHMDWYTGNTLLQYLEACNAHSQPASAHMRYSVQYAITANNETGYAGRLLHGKMKKGDTVTIYPGNTRATISKIMKGYNEVLEAGTNDMLCICLENGTAARGSILASGELLYQSKFEISLCWVDATKDMVPGKEYILRINSRETSCVITSIVYKTDENDFSQKSGGETLSVNEFAVVIVETQDKMAYDVFSIVPANGRGIIIDKETNYTSGAFVVN